jgi:hypothetical protein
MLLNDHTYITRPLLVLFVGSVPRENVLRQDKSGGEKIEWKDLDKKCMHIQIYLCFSGQDNR